MKLRLLAVAAALLAAAAPALADDAADHPAYWGTPSVDGGKCCATLADVRVNIDRIDRQIDALMAERGQYGRRGRALQGRSRRGERAGAGRGDRRQGEGAGARGRPCRERRRTQLSRHDRRVRGLRARRMDAPQRGRDGAGEVSEGAVQPAWRRAAARRSSRRGEKGLPSQSSVHHQQEALESGPCARIECCFRRASDGGERRCRRGAAHATWRALEVS